MTSHTTRSAVVLALGVALATNAPGAEPVADADLVLRNGTIVTVDDDLGTVQALAVHKGRIVAVGSDDEMKPHIGAATAVLDLEGRLAVPGFIEGHGHFIGLGRAKMVLDLMHVANWNEVVTMVAEAAAQADPGDWILGRGWHQEKWDRPPPNAVDGFPQHHELSAVSPDNPVILTHASGHACFANMKAMEMAGISGTTPDPPGGEILRNENGDAIGVFNERAQGMLGGPGRGMSRRQQIAQTQRAIREASRECLAKGVTSFQDAGSTFYEIDALAADALRGELGVRLWVMIREPNETVRAYAPEYARKKRLGGGFLTVGGIKRSIDGALGSRGAWLLEPYADLPDSTGLATATVESVTESAQLALANGLQCCVHAIGDRANREVLDIYAKVLAGHEDAAGLRWRIEHAQHLHPDDVPRFGRQGVIASMQGVHCTSDAPWVYARLGRERARTGAYVWQDLMATGAIVTNGTDAPVEDVDPIASFHSTVTRRTKDGSVFFGDQRMTRMEALKSYTINAAYAAFEDDVKGTLTPGKYADVVVLTRNIMEVPDEEITEARVHMTIVDGKLVYEGK